MLGFLFGTACFIGLFKVLHRGRGPWRNALLRRVFERLDTTPGQEKVIFAAVDFLEGAFARAGEQARSSRGAAAGAIRSEHFDAAALGQTFARNSAALDELHQAVTDALRMVHEALRPEQRRQMADLITYGPRAAHGCGGVFRSRGCGPRWAGGHSGGAVHL